MSKDKVMDKEEYRCEICGIRFNFEHLKEKHLYKEHPEVFFRRTK